MGFGTICKNGVLHFTALVDGITEDFGPGHEGRLKAFNYLTQKRATMIAASAEEKRRVSSYGTRILLDQFRKNEDLLKDILKDRELQTSLVGEGVFLFSAYSATGEFLFKSDNFLKMLEWLKEPKPTLTLQSKI
ncbi:hypothetical protein G6L37_17575 [Agrobacterium rubi]|uniref:hypothetical protein n=1 Tax=Agrobacterium rubi TaxID=28099 RepID=UPI001573676D|nr:hypothetical protein [Agrobacterium rubi]NTF07964.1 hypothetical protein [Agrobacterium rubi]NTF20208.1 hypothetical protein [Agrobacterium rubi]NTF27179.1 hypothetical protein [Agrobacterium rubi]